MRPIILIPARMASTRLPDKPMADIAGAPMIVHVWRRAMEAAKMMGGARVVVACDGEAIAGAIRKAGGEAVLTDPNLPSGSDRIFQALEIVDPHATHDVVINLQGDMPTLDPQVVIKAVTLLHHSEVQIATLAAVIKDEKEKTDPAVVKAVIAENGRALYFSRATIPAGDGLLYHHIGIYVYRREVLAAFVSLPASSLEKREKLEQLRALEAGMRIEVAIVDTVPLGVDTKETLEKARALLL